MLSPCSNVHLASLAQNPMSDEVELVSVRFRSEGWNGQCAVRRRPRFVGSRDLRTAFGQWAPVPHGRFVFAADALERTCKRGAARSRRIAARRFTPVGRSSSGCACVERNVPRRPRPRVVSFELTIRRSGESAPLTRRTRRDVRGAKDDPSSNRRARRDRNTRSR